MADWRGFNATNEPRTCLWCGRRLLPRHKFRQPTAQEIADGASTYKHVPDGIAGYGSYADGFFCGLRCGFDFALVLARLGRRLEPLTKEDHD